MIPEDLEKISVLYGPPPFWEKAPVSAISRFRINVDGSGVNTLVTFYGCPLDCKHCLNAYMKKVPENLEWMSTMELYEKVKKDNIYFRATSGGITFGGGEPLLRADFIREFKEKYAQDWKIRVETSLNIHNTDVVYRLLPIVDEWIIDVKTLNKEIYENYTKGLYLPLQDNIKTLVLAGEFNKYLIRVPLIAGYNDEEDRQHTVNMLKYFGFTRFDLFTYKIPDYG